jgi:hypothetical protein
MLLRYKTEAILDFIRNSEASMTTALIPPGFTSLLQPLDTAINGPFKQLLQKKKADIYVCELIDTGKMPDLWTLRDRREMVTVIVGRAWERLQKDPDLIKRAFLQYSISIHPDGTEDHLINIKGVDNSSIDPNGWRSSSEYRSYEMVSEDFDYITALISATEKLKPSIKTVTFKQLQKKCMNRGLAKSGTKPELVARLQAYEAGNVKREEFATIDLILGTPIPDTPIPSPSSPRAFDFPEDYPASEEEDSHDSKPPFQDSSVTALDPAYGQEVNKPRAPAIGGPGGPMWTHRLTISSLFPPELKM